MKGSVLFVDDERNVLQGLRRSLHQKRGDWDLHFACGAKEALCVIDEVNLDVVVTDMRMPEMNGAGVLAHVLRNQPAAVRFVLSGQSEHSATLDVAGVSHQFYSKPCDIRLLVTTIDGLLEHRAALPSGLVKAISAVQSLPATSADCLALQSALAGPSENDMAAVLAQVPGAAIKILQLTNSTYFGHAVEITSPAKAASMLGRSLVAELFDRGLLVTEEKVVCTEYCAGEPCTVTQDFSEDAELRKLVQSMLVLNGELGMVGNATDNIQGLHYLFALWGIPEKLLKGQEHPI